MISQIWKNFSILKDRNVSFFLFSTKYILPIIPCPPGTKNRKECPIKWDFIISPILGRYWGLICKNIFQLIISMNSFTTVVKNKNIIVPNLICLNIEIICIKSIFLNKKNKMMIDIKILKKNNNFFFFIFFPAFF